MTLTEMIAEIIRQLQAKNITPTTYRIQAGLKAVFGVVASYEEITHRTDVG